MEMPIIQLSHSSKNEIRSCEQKYMYRKVLRVKPDADADTSMTALDVGNCVHTLLEETNHELRPTETYKMFPTVVEKLLEPYKNAENYEERLENINKNKQLIIAMAIKLQMMQKHRKFKAVAIELHLMNKKMQGFIDLIASDEDGKWWIVDVKTYATFGTKTVAGLRKDYQLNLYASQIKYICEETGLDPRKFGGCILRVASKSKASMRAKESEMEFIKRLVDKHVKAYDTTVLAKDLNIMEIAHDHIDYHNRATELHLGEAPKRNYNSCFDYFRPCPYFSKCHGVTFTEMEKQLDIVEI